MRESHDPELGTIRLAGEFSDPAVAKEHLALALEEDSVSDLDTADLAFAQGLIAPRDISGPAFEFANRGLSILVPVAPAPPSATATDGKTPAPAGETTEAPGDQASELAQTISAGLPALDVVLKLWNFIDDNDRKQLAKAVVENLYTDRSTYARSVRWSLSPDAEMWAYLEGRDRTRLASGALKERLGLADHQVDLAQTEVEIRQTSVKVAEESVKQQKVVTDMLKEFLEHLKMWTSLASHGRAMLWFSVVASLALLIATLVWVWRDDVDPWVFPAATFALALFAISPAVLLILGRPLKGLDEWKPGDLGPQTEEPSEETEDGTASTSSGQAPSTVSFGETNQPKAYGPSGSLRT